MKTLAALFRGTGAALVAGAMLFVFGLYAAEVLGHYGYGLFVGLPFAGGFVSVLFYGDVLSRRLRASVCMGIYALAVGAILFLVTGFEGMICLAMAAPIMLGFVIAGVIVAIAVSWMVGKLAGSGQGNRGDGINVGILAALLIPLLLGMHVEPRFLPHPPTRMVHTSVVVRGDIAKVWETVVAFPEITSPPGGIFDYGIAYPIRASIEGTGVGAIRRCTFNTGDFVEPITAWEEPNRLAFDVVENPLPMKEWSFWGEIDTPHLHGFMVSERGQFQLTEQADGTVLLEGTTWYHQNLWPNAYWGAVSDQIIHRIHGRVLGHIKDVVEGGMEPS